MVRCTCARTWSRYGSMPPLRCCCRSSASAPTSVRPGFFGAVVGRPLAMLAALVAAAGMVSVFVGLRRRAHLLAFIGSGVFLAGLLASTAAAVFPVMLHATGGEALSLTAYNASATDSSLRVAIRWWLVGIPLVAIYFATVFRIHRGKAVAAVGREGY